MIAAVPEPSHIHVLPTKTSATAIIETSHALAVTTRIIRSQSGRRRYGGDMPMSWPPRVMFNSKGRRGDFGGRNVAAEDQRELALVGEKTMINLPAVPVGDLGSETARTLGQRHRFIAATISRRAAAQFRNIIAE